MQTAARIIEPAISAWVAEGRELVRAVHEAETSERQLEEKLTTTREAARARRIELGTFLAARKDQIKYGEWGEFCDALEISRSSAFRYMRDAGRLFQEDELKQLGVDPSEMHDAPPPSDSDAPAELLDQGGEPEVEIDRDTWCTPAWITEALGRVDLDPCANERSHVKAATEFDLEQRDEDGLVLASGVPPDWRVFVNPPYSNVTPWIEAYAHTRFCFLLKLDPSTKWFELLIEQVELVLIPRRTRVEFEPPPGVPANISAAQPFPHALFFAKRKDAPKKLIDLCYAWRL